VVNIACEGLIDSSGTAVGLEERRGVNVKSVSTVVVGTGFDGEPDEAAREYDLDAEGCGTALDEENEDVQARTG
jgi:hypothetical protein